MTTKSLYNEYEALSDTGSELAHELDMAVRPIIEHYAALDYPLREIDSIAIHTVTLITSEMILRAAMKIRKTERSQHARP